METPTTSVDKRASRTILEPILRHAERHPERLLYAFYDANGRVRSSFTYDAFLHRSNALAAHLLREGHCRSGDRVLLVYPPGIEMLCAFFACVRLGCIPVPVPPPSSHGYAASLHRMRFIADDCGATTVLTDRAYYWSMKLRRVRSRLGRSDREDFPRRLRWVSTTDLGSADEQATLLAPSDIVLLQYTSGSTAEPRGVVVSHENVRANGAAIFDRPPVGVSWLPQYHDMGLIGSCLFVAMAGGTLHLSSPLDFIQNPVTWLRAISRHRATASVAPNFAYEFCLRPDRVRDADLDGLDLSSLELLMNGAEPVRPEVVEAFTRRFEPFGLRRDAFCVAYGLAEYTLAVSNRGTRVCTFDADRLTRHRAQLAAAEHEHSGVRRLVSCGRPVTDTEIRIVDASGAPRVAEEGRVGEIWVDGPGRCLGYWNRPDLSSQTFEARLDGEPDKDRRWLRTGDLGFMLDGELFVCGRLKDLIIVRGLNYYPQDVEAVVAGHAGIRKGCVAAFAVDTPEGEGLAVVAELRNGTAPASAEELNRELRRRVGIVADSFTYVAKHTLPKTSSGKIMRRETRRRLRDGHLEVLLDLACRPTVRDELSPAPPSAADGPTGQWGTPATLVRTFEARKLSGSEDATLGDLGLDSLAIAELGADVERHLEAVGAEDLARGVDLRWLQRISASELFALLSDVITAVPSGRLRFRRALTGLREEQLELERRMMLDDTRLELPAVLVERPDPDPTVGGGAALLTGGTGFFGPFLLRSLLEQREGPIYVLVRADDDNRAWERLDGALRSLGPELASPALDGWRARVVPIRGDLGRPRLGLCRSDWARLASVVEEIVHNGAWVNYLHEYALLRDVNVLGTREVVRLATDGRLKVVNHVSTTFVFGWSTTETLSEEDTNEDLTLLDFGYSQSKWVAEQLVLKAIEQGVPARVFRPALIAPSLCGAGEQLDIAMRLLAFMVKHGVDTTALNQVSLSPADLVADNIIAISGLRDTVGQTFHVTRDERSTMRDVTRLLARRTGTRFTSYELGSFVPEVVSRCTSEDPLFPLLNFLVRSVEKISAMEFKEYDNRNYRSARARSGSAREDPPLHEVVDGILRFLRRHSLVGAGPAVLPTEQSSGGRRC
jgi:thioester reductase-like protein